jgi:uncharacterized protein (TIGR02757 family)
MDNLKINKKSLEKLYKKFNNKKYIHPDPLEFLYLYKNKKDIEIVALLASSLAYGRVCQILKSVSIVLEKLGKNPYDFILKTNDFNKLFKGFKHRFTKDYEISNFFYSLKKILIKYGSLENMFINCIFETFKPISNLDDFNILLKKKTKLIQDNYLILLNNFIKKFELNKTSLLADPEKQSACKRLNLFLKWMIRKDNVDLGIWNHISSEILIIPLDTHMYKFAKLKGLTKRKDTSFKTAIEITNSFKKYAPFDPTKYDFAITRFGIWKNIVKKN